MESSSSVVQALPISSPPIAMALPADGSFGASATRFTVGSVISRTFSVWKKNFLTFASISLVLHSPMLVSTLVLGAPGSSLRNEVIRGLMSVVGVVLTFVLSGALTFGVFQSLSGATARFGEMVNAGFSRFWRILGVSLLIGLLLIPAMLALVIPAFFVFSAYWVAVPAVVAEPVSVTSALSRSAQLTRGHRLTVFLVALVLAAIAMGIAAVIGALGVGAMLSTTSGAIAFQFAIQLASAVAGSLTASAPAVGYHDLRVLKEGASTEQLAAVFA